METFTSVLAQILRLYQMPMNIYGFTFSFWDVTMFAIIATTIMRFIGRVLYD